MKNVKKEYISLVYNRTDKANLPSAVKVRVLLSIIKTIHYMEPDNYTFTGEHIMRYVDEKRGKRVQNLPTFLKNKNPVLVQEFKANKAYLERHVGILLSVYGYETTYEIGRVFHQIGEELLDMESKSKNTYSKKMK